MQINFAKPSDVTVGTILYPDGDFTCMGANEPRQVKVDELGLYIACDEGCHHLDGQLVNGEYRGLSLTPISCVEVGERQAA